MAKIMFSFRKLLQYLWFRGVHHRRIIDYIGAIEGSPKYRYIREACSKEYEEMCATMPRLLKDSGFDVVFRNEMISAFYYEKINQILKDRTDPIMNNRIHETMGGSNLFLMLKVCLVWGAKLSRDFITRLKTWYWRLRTNNKGVSLGKIRNLVDETDFNCIMLSNKYAKVLSAFHSGVYKSLCENSLKPLFIYFGDRYDVKKEEKGAVVEIPSQYMMFPRYSDEEQTLLKTAVSWVADLKIPYRNQGKIKRNMICQTRNDFPQYLYLKNIAAVILSDKKSKCVLSFAEAQIGTRIFIHKAKTINMPTLLFYHVDGIHQLIYDRYLSDTVLVANKIQYKNFLSIGYQPQQCHVVGSFNFALPKHDGPSGTRSILRIDGAVRFIYFTKGTKSIDEGVLKELVEKMNVLKRDYYMTIKKHPKDINSYGSFKNEKVFITGDLDFMKYVDKSDIVISQYSGVMRRIIPLRKPLILYTYSDILEYGERAFFKNVKLPNYLKYVQNKKELHQAIDQLLDLKDPEPLPQELAEYLYGYLDEKCGSRITDVVGHFVTNESSNSAHSN